MTRLSTRFKSFYVITSFFLIVFLFYPLKTFGAVIDNSHTLTLQSGTQSLSENNIRTIYSTFSTNGATSGVSVLPQGFYCANSVCASKVFTSTLPLSHTVFWQGGPTQGLKTPDLVFTSNEPSKFLRLEVCTPTTCPTLACPGTTPNKLGILNQCTYPFESFFTSGAKVGFPATNISTGYIDRIYTMYYPRYSFIVRSVPPPSISTFTASSPAVGSNGSYQLISGNSFTLTWEVANATATTQCALTQVENPEPLKTFDNTDTNTTNDFTLSGTTKSFSHTISNLTANTTYKVSCSHNGLGIVPADSLARRREVQCLTLTDSCSKSRGHTR